MPLDNSAAGWVWWFVAGVMAPALAIYMLVTGPGDLANAWKAAHGGGQLGTLHVTRKECGYHRVTGYICTGLHGDYTSDDRATFLQDAFLDGIPRGARIGSDVKVRLLGERNPTIVYRASGSHEWLLIGALLLAALAALSVWALTVTARLRGQYLPWMIRPWTKPRVGRDPRSPDKTGHRRRRRKRR